MTRFAFGKKLRFLVVSSMALALALTTATQLPLISSELVPTVQAQGGTCSEAKVNVEFRKWTGKEYAGWTTGSSFKPKTGDFIDVNCFAKDGRALLTKGTFKAEVKQGTKITKLTSSLFARPDVRKYKLDCAGTYTFTCSNSVAACTDRDTFVVTGQNTADCQAGGDDDDDDGGGNGTFSKADINRDGKVDMTDVDAFYRAFRKDFTRK
jgi:hypothetical protein